MGGGGEEEEAEEERYEDWEVGGEAEAEAHFDVE